MRKFLLLIFIFSSPVAYTQKNSEKLNNSNKNSYIFEGIIKGMDSGWIYIAHPDTTGKDYSYLDSSKIINNSFKFTGTMMNPEPCIFVFKPGENSIHFTSYFILDKGHTIGTLFKDSMHKSVVVGTSSQNQFQKFISAYNDLYSKHIQLQMALSKNPTDSNLLNALTLTEIAQITLINQSVKTNPHSLVSAYIIGKYFPLNAKVSDLEDTYNILLNTDNYYSRKILKEITVKINTSIGHEAPKFSIIDNTNTEITNVSFPNKYLLVDFWASWCVPCRNENPFLLKAYSQFHDKGFDILSISLDDHVRLWEVAVKEDKLPWKQACDYKAFKSPLSISFGIKYIPTNFLIDKTGKIIERDLKGEQLIDKLNKLIND